MRVLVACEDSQAVTKVCREYGIEAYSCDLLECSGGHPEWHIQGDVIPLLDGCCEFQTMDGIIHQIDSRWNAIIAFPPCTKTSNAGARHLYRGGKLNLQRYFEGMCGLAFLQTIFHADCDVIIIENPTPSRVFGFPKPFCSTQPYHHGHPFTKLTHFWCKGIKEPLKPTNMVQADRTWCPSGSYSGRHGEQHKGMFTTDRAKNRAKTFDGVARAIVAQWLLPTKEDINGRQAD